MALVIHRRLGDRIVVESETGETIEILVKAIKRSEVSLIFLGGKSFHVDRAECREHYKEKRDKQKEISQLAATPKAEV